MSLMSRILVVEDNPSNMKLVTAILAQAGHAALAAPDGARGVMIAEAERPALILLDLQMPAMDGFAVLEALRANPATAAIPVVALTAMAMAGDRERILAAGFDDYLAKPIRYRALLDCVQSLIDRAHAAVGR